MQWEISKEKEICGYMMSIALIHQGEDILVSVQGGSKPHIGCCILSVPRPSLTGDNHISATSSILNVTGHKDDYLCRQIGELICSHTGKTVVCIGGVHIDKIQPEQIQEIVDGMMALVKEIIKEKPLAAAEKNRLKY